jgi:hypothetical protein
MTAGRGRESAPSAVLGERLVGGLGLGGPVDSLFESSAADDLRTVAEARPHAGFAMFIPKLRDAVVQLAELVGEDDVVSQGQTLQENGAVLAGALDLATDFLDRLHTFENEPPRSLIPAFHP